MSHWSTILFFILVYSLFQMAAPVYGQQPPKDILQVEVGADMIYDTNVWQYSDADRILFELFPNAQFFQKTDSVDDFIWEPSVQLSLHPPWGSKTPKLLVGAMGDFYTQNTSLNSGTYWIGIEQEITPNIQLSVTYTWIPRVLLGMSREQRIPPTPLIEETYTSHDILIYILKEFRNLDMGLSAHYTFQDYTDALNEQDSDLYGFGSIAAFYPVPEVETLVGYQFELGIAAGRNDAGQNNDLSYMAHQFQIEPKFRVTKPLHIAVHYELNYKEFTTDLTSDRNHHGRKDLIHGWGIDLYYGFGEKIETKLSFQRVFGTTNQNDTFFSYDEDMTTVGIRIFM
ncbi:MAG: hypothetical protein L0Y56_15180 [Nitrospira sp.]|nr:hypothetical protein [Nitrospira sp.]